MKNIYKLIEKYQTQAPRYTSYPAVPFWNQKITSDKWLGDVSRSYNPDIGADFYVHVPYCRQLCYYCGCHRSILKGEKAKAVSASGFFVDALLSEFEIYKNQIPNLRPHSIHLGGGTPTFLAPNELERLFRSLLKNAGGLASHSIEVDPRTTSIEHLEVLEKWGFRRISMGIQDFDENVQKKINRIQSFELVEKLLLEVRRRGFESINFDLIYGLPGQNLEGMKQTVEQVLKLRPEMIAYYSYAHVPWKMQNQKLIKESDLPKPELKLELSIKIRELFLSNGYIDIGLDHFVLPDSVLGKVYRNGKLLRNFMGYTDKRSSTLIGLGPSSISATPSYFAQNEKDIQKYLDLANSCQLPVLSGHKMDERDISTNSLIQQIMCHGKWPKNSDSISVKEKLAAMANDGLIQSDDSFYFVTDLGKLFLRNFASLYDPYLEESRKQLKDNAQFSKTI